MSSKTKRWTIGFLVVGAWLLMMGWLVRREVGPGVVVTGDRAPARLTAPRESWMGLFAGEERQVGHVHVHHVPEEREGLAGERMRLAARMTLNLLGRPTDLDLRGAVWRPYDVPRADFEFTVRSAEYDFHLEGEVRDGLLRGKIRSAGETVPLEVPIDEEVVFANGLGTALAFPDLEVGEEARLVSFDPLTMSQSPMRVRCTARETLTIAGGARATRRLRVSTGGIDTSVWIDEQGEVVQAQTPLGLVLREISPPSSPSEIPTVEGEEILQLTAIQPSGVRPFRGASTSVLRLVSEHDRELPQDSSQVALGDGRFRRTAFPPSGSPTGDLPEDEARRYLKGDAFVQSDHPRIRLQAEEIVAREEDPWRRAQALHRWVFETLEKEPVMSVPSALEVLEKRRGDCNEHTVLFTALARAAGLPARIAIGLVWSDDLDGFYYHAWPEVYVGDWIWMDPTLDQTVADATHVKLLNGGIEKWPQLLPYLGKLEIEVLEIE